MTANWTAGEVPQCPKQRAKLIEAALQEAERGVQAARDLWPHVREAALRRAQGVRT